jgi:hypothetical protein
MIDYLQQEIAEFIPEIVEIAARDGVGHLIGFLDGVGRDGRKILLEVPWTAAAGVRSAAMISSRREISREGSWRYRGLRRIRLYAA